MFKCKDCNKEYNIKPDYCDCGNDLFEEISIEVPSAETPQIEAVIKKSPQDIKKIISYVIFALCIIFAIIPWLIPIKETPNTPKVLKEKVEKNMPDIDTLWKETSPEKKTSETVEPPVESNIEPPIKNVTTKVSTTKTQAVKPKVQTKTVTPAKATAKTTTKTAAKAATVKKQLEQQELQEFSNYKGSLRQALHARLNLGNVQGNGECIIEFNIESNGKLANRKFVKQSSNKSFNDEVYLMMMRLPYFDAPPAAYKGEKIRLKFAFNDGNYEISFVQ